MQKLTKRVVDSIRPSGLDKKIFDSQLPGFHVRVKPSGTKSYALKYRVAGRQRNVTIGRHGVITPDQARMEAFRLLATISEGDDPSAIRKAAFRDPTLAQLWEEYLERHALPRKAPSSIREDRGLWRLYIGPALGYLKVNAINRNDISRLHDSKRHQPACANHILCLLSKMMNLAIEWEYRSDNPCRGIKKFHEEPRNRFLSTEERDRLTQALHEEPDQASAIAIWLCRFTGARKGKYCKRAGNNSISMRRSRSGKFPRHIPSRDASTESLCPARQWSCCRNGRRSVRNRPQDGSYQARIPRNGDQTSMVRGAVFVIGQGSWMSACTTSGTILHQSPWHRARLLKSSAGISVMPRSRQPRDMRTFWTIRFMSWPSK